MIDKINRNFKRGAVIYAVDMNDTDNRINEIIDVVNMLDVSVGHLIENKMDIDGSNYVGNTELVTPELSNQWYIYDASCELKRIYTEKDVTVEFGANVKFLGKWKWTEESGRKNPTDASGFWGASIPASGEYSEEKSSDMKTTDTTFTQTIYGPLTGLVTEEGLVKKASGLESKTFTASVDFSSKRYFGGSATMATDSSSLATVIATLQNKTDNVTSEFSEEVEKDFNLKYDGLQYIYYIIPVTSGEVTQTIVNHFLFTDWVVSVIPYVNEYGSTINYRVYMSNGLKTTGSAGLEIEIK